MFLSIPAMDGDPADLLARRRRHMDPVVTRLAPRHGALATVTVPGEHGITVYNLWQTAEGAAAFTEAPEAQQAQREPGLPTPSRFERYPDAEIVVFGQP